MPALARARAEGAAGLAGPRAAAHLQPPSPAPSDRVSGALRRPPRPGAAPVGRADAPGGDDRPAVPPEPTPPNPRPGAADVGGLLAAAVRAGRAAREGSTERSAAERGGARAGGTAGVHTREASTA
ncbi:hypothetical protein LUX12_01455 [Streptomyces somaliensis]|uniref:hypothetical protein n=1 Tax=Streptomyces somaliensis TaxID=78355 RepID=UPI0020CCA37C|nr:hypothetical protein [Streptomyces somaliensis]MCP9943769.1 hypothetical protein [Streptomyces somaliensis]